MRYSYFKPSAAGWVSGLIAAVPLAGTLWRVMVFGIEAGGNARLYDCWLGQRTLAEGTLFSGQSTEPAIINAPVPGAGWVNTTGRNPYTITNGQTLTFNFTGTGFDLRSFCDNRGGLWNIEVDGVALGSVSVFRSSAAYYTLTNVVRGLTSGAHTCVMTFAGADPANAPSGGVARGWISRETNAVPSSADLQSYGTVRVADIREIYSVTHQVLMVGSNVEIAISARPQGAAYAHAWWPAHAAVETNTQVSRSIYVDGVELVDPLSRFGVWAECQSIECAQVSTGSNSGSGSAVTMHQTSQFSQITSSGYAYSGLLTFGVNCQVSTGYACMGPAQNTDLAVYSDGATVNVSAHNNIMLTAPTNVPGCLLVDPVRHPYALATEITAVSASIREGRPGAVANWNRVQPRTDAVRTAKVYPHAFATDANIDTGEQWSFAGRLSAGLAPA
jgi:hypothetical protein